MPPPDKKNIQDILALTPMQEGMLFHYLKNPESDLYFEQLTLNISGEIDEGIFQKAWNLVIQNNEMLRVVFRWEKLEKPVQIILKGHKCKVTFYDLSEKDSNQRKAALEKIKTNDRHEGFGLNHVPFRVILVRIEEKRYQVIVSNHHILYDGWSSGIILKEFFNAYHDLSSGKAWGNPAKTKFKEFIKGVQDRDVKKGKKFWKNYLTGFDTQTRLSIKKSRKQEKKTSREFFKVVLVKDKKNEIENFVKKHKVTLSALLYSAWGLLLQQYNNSGDVVFGTTVSGRTAKIPGIERIVGLFINTVPLRIQTQAKEKTADLLQRINKSLQMREAYETTSLVNIKECSQIDNQEELFDSIVIIENYPLDRRLILENRQLSVDSYSVFETTHYDLTISLLIDHDIEIIFSYTKEFFDKETVRRLANHFKGMVERIIRNPEKEIPGLEIISEEEKNKILYEFNAKGTDYPKEKTIHRLFEEQTERTPDHTALVGGNPKSQIPNPKQGGTRGLAPLHISYRELNEKSDRLAYTSIEKGVQPDTIVAIMVERSIEMVVSLLGILKTGSPYLPIDPAYPAERIRYILADSNAEVLVTIPGLSEKFEKLSIVNCQLLMVNEKSTARRRLNNPPKETNSINNYQLTINNLQLKGNNLAYIIYTSGSTGRPKGVMVEHCSVINVLLALQEKYPFLEEDNYLLKTTYTFDVSVSELFGWFLDGGRLTILKPGGEKEPQCMLDWIERFGVTHINFVPSMFGVFLDILDPYNLEPLSSLKYIFLAGEALSPYLVNKFKALNTGISLENIYGPTESTIYASQYPISKWDAGDSIPIGKPLPNLELYIFNQYDGLQPIGVMGELYIAGEGLTRGYLNRPELTKEKFPGHPLKENQRVYRTGDLARWLPDGNIEFLGRVDHQVKIRGVRIELGEIETQLLKHEGIKEVVVIPRSDKTKDANPYLCAYIVPSRLGMNADKVAGERAPGVTELRKHLSWVLPDYMIPSYFIEVEQIPLNPNGKVDRKALPKPDESTTRGGGYKAPGNQVEEMLVEIWREVLGVDKIGIEDDFFQRGGDSINAIQITSRIQKYGYKLDINDLLLNPTIKQSAKYIKRTDRMSHQGIVEGRVPLTPIQKWFFENDFTDNHHFNQAVMLFSRRGFKGDIVEAVFNRIVAHHDALRMVYEIDGGNIIQMNRGMKSKLFDFEMIPLNDGDNAAEKIEREANRMQGEFDLAAAPLVKLGLFKTNKGDYLLIVIHHLVVDGVSWRIILEDFAIGYGQALRGENICFQEKTDSFMYWASGLKRYAEGDRVLNELDYWNSLETIEIERLPRDYQPGAELKKNRNLEVVTLDLNEEETKEILIEVNHAYRTEINDILLTALGMAVKEWAGIERVFVNLEGHGREPIIEGIDISRTLGWFTSLYPVVLDMSKSEDLSYGIKFIKETLRKIPNRGIGYGILRYLLPEEKKDALRFRIRPEINFNYMGQFEKEARQNMEIFRLSGISVGDCRGAGLESLYTIDINGIVMDGRLSLTFAYNKYEYEKESIENLVDRYKICLRKIVKHCMERTERELTPSDLGARDISIEELNSIKEMLEI